MRLPACELVSNTGVPDFYSILAILHFLLIPISDSINNYRDFLFLWRTNMAKKNTAKSKINRSEAIRQVLKATPDMQTKDVVSTLAGKGVTVTADLVYFVKGQIQGRKGKKKKDNKDVAKVAKPSGAINKSEQIRKSLDANPDMKAKEVVSTLAAKGIKVSEGLVHLVKGKRKGRQHRKEKARKMIAKVTETTGKTGHHDAVTLILKVKHLASEVGGMAKLKALVEALS